MRKEKDSNVVAIGQAKRRLKPGDIVQLLTGGCSMVVGSLAKDGSCADCYWVDDGILTNPGNGISHIHTRFYWSKVFPVTVLKRVKA